MIMRSGQQLLLPVNPVFIGASLISALAFNMVVNMAWAGRAAWVPDLLAVFLVFWTVHQPRRLGVGTAFLFGLLMDVHNASLLGQHALSYTAMSFMAILIHRRVLWFSVPSQSLQVLPLFVVALGIELLARWPTAAAMPGWPVVFAPFLQALLWPLANVLLLAPQRRAPDPDANRPL